MIIITERIEAWQVDEVRRYLEREFVGSRIDDYARGGHAAHLFTVTEAGLAFQRGARHLLLVTRSFFDRCADLASFRDALETAELGKQLRREGERTVTLY
jgi:hypothetical protein